MRLATLAVAFGLAACGRTQTFTGSEDASALDSGEPRCDRDGGVPALDRAKDASERLLAWGNLDACIDVSYEVALAPLLPDLRAALADWSYPGCTWICFTAPVPREDRPVARGDRRIHLGLIRSGDQLPEDVDTTNLNYDGVEIYSASMLIDQKQAEPGQAPLLVLAGQVLGFLPTPAVDSALNHRLPGDVPHALTPADEESVCAAYPSCR